MGLTKRYIPYAGRHDRTPGWPSGVRHAVRKHTTPRDWHPTLRGMAYGVLPDRVGPHVARGVPSHRDGSLYG